MKPSSTPQKDKSLSKSSKSATSRPADADGPRTPIQFVKGVGPRLGSLLASRGIETVQDLLYFFPRAYEDRTQLKRVSELRDGELASLQLTVLTQRRIPIRGRSGGLFEVRAQDSDGKTLSLKWFRAYPGIEQRFSVGASVRVVGKVKFFRGSPEIIHPEIQSGGKSGEKTLDAAPEGLVPVYTEVEGIPSRVLRNALKNAIEKFAATLPEDVPEYLRERHELPYLHESIRQIHFPDPRSKPELISDLVNFRTRWQQRLIYDEFLKFEYVVLRRRLHRRKDEAQALEAEKAKTDFAQAAAKLPFTLTGDQRRAIEESLIEMSQPFPMNRLIQGDVGSGKTAVALLCAYCCGKQSMQSLLMAPTEILAEQHYLNAVKLFGSDFRVELLTGSTPQSKRNEISALARSDTPLLVIGTHALLEDWLVFKNLGLVLIDEQHRFGVEQRRKLRNKGVRAVNGRTFHPSVVILTATPIPRTLALTAYGDLTISSIKELPPGRQPIETRVVDPAIRHKTMEFIRQELAKGRQAYFIFPLVDESEAEGFEELRAAVTEAERLANEVFPEFKIGLLHGQLKPDEKAQVMDRFKRGELHILVSTTVVEVGVDVPNANIIVIENAERFGLSQLHQLRGRVGRGSHASFCFLQVGYAVGETSQARLEIMEETRDGFRIAEADLEIRGPGEFLGTRQSGALPFKLASLVRDQDWLKKAREDAIDILKEDPELLLDKHASLKRYFTRDGVSAADLFKTG